jgi:hypothetical protein
VSARSKLQSLAERYWGCGPYGAGAPSDLCRRWLERARWHPGAPFDSEWLRPGYVLERFADDRDRETLRTLTSDEIRDVFLPELCRLTASTPQGPRVFKIPGTNGDRQVEGT